VIGEKITELINFKTRNMNVTFTQEELNIEIQKEEQAITDCIQWPDDEELKQIAKNQCAVVQGMRNLTI
jgi:hypothetical protein